MKKFIYSLLSILFSLSFTANAQDAIEVRFLGNAPDIIDFAWSYVTADEAAGDHIDDEEEECCTNESLNAVKHALEAYRTGEPQGENVTFTVDRKAGYIRYEYQQDQYSVVSEMCYWNESDRKHKLFACKVELLIDGKRLYPGQFDGLEFYRYDPATRKMSPVDVGIEVEYHNISYALPRTGKDITVTRWDDKGRATQSTLKWNGQGFTK